MPHRFYNTNSKNLYLLLLALGVSVEVNGQDTKDKIGKIETNDIEIIKNAKVTLNQANRIFEKIYTNKMGADKKPIRYEFVERKMPIEVQEFSPVVTMPIKNTSENDYAEKYHNVIRGGIGNYGHTFLEGHGGILTSKDNYHGVYFKHNAFRSGPVASNYSGQSQNQLRVHSRTSFNNVKLDGALGWERRGFDYYAAYIPNIVNPPESAFFNSWNKFSFIGNINNINKNSKVDYTFKSNLSYLSTHLKANELVWKGDLKGVYPLTEQLSALLDGSVMLSQRQDSTTLFRSLYKLKPTFQFKANNFSITAGINVVNDREKTTFNNSYIYPVLKIDGQPMEGIKIFAGYDGDVYANTLTSLLAENQWIARFTPLKNTRKIGDIYLGGRANLANGLSIEVKGSYATYQDFYVFNNSKADSSRFEVAYSDDTTKVKVLNISGQVSYQIPQLWKTNFKFDVNTYNHLGNLVEPWHLPFFNATWNNTFTVREKLFVSSDWYIISGLKGKNVQTDREVKLKPIIDLNLKFTYLLSDHWDVFISANNILNKSYQRYLYYPTQGVNFLGGMSYSF